VKRRYKIKINGRIAELDVYQEKLVGLVVIDFEFDNEAEMRSFATPEFVLADVTQGRDDGRWILGGQIAR